MLPKISIVLPVYQGTPHLKKAVESALSQKGVPFEVLISDDGSTDGSIEYLESLEDSRVRVFRKPNGAQPGLFYNLNRLLKEVRSPLIQILCQDDSLTDDCLEKTALFFEKHPEIGMSTCASIRINSQDQILNRSEAHHLPEVLRIPLALQHFYFHGCIPGNLSTVCIRKSALEAVGPFNPRFSVSGDYEMWSRIAEKFPIGIIPQHLSRIRLHDGQLSRQEKSLVPFVKQNTLILDFLETKIPKDRIWLARLTRILRHGTLDFHKVYKACARGKFGLALQIAHALGIFRTFIYSLAWLLTLNRRLFYPPAPFVLSAKEIEEHTELYRQQSLRESTG